MSEAFRAAHEDVVAFVYAPKARGDVDPDEYLYAPLWLCQELSKTGRVDFLHVAVWGLLYQIGGGFPIDKSQVSRSIAWLAKRGLAEKIVYRNGSRHGFRVRLLDPFEVLGIAHPDPQQEFAYKDEPDVLACPQASVVSSQRSGAAAVSVVSSQRSCNAPDDASVVRSQRSCNALDASVAAKSETQAGDHDRAAAVGKSSPTDRSGGASSSVSAELGDAQGHPQASPQDRSPSPMRVPPRARAPLVLECAFKPPSSFVPSKRAPDAPLARAGAEPADVPTLGDALARVLDRHLTAIPGDRDRTAVVEALIARIRRRVACPLLWDSPARRVAMAVVHGDEAGHRLPEKALDAILLWIDDLRTRGQIIVSASACFNAGAKKEFRRHGLDWPDEDAKPKPR